MASRRATLARRAGRPVPPRVGKQAAKLVNTEESPECYDCLINKVKAPKEYKRLRKFGKCPNEGCNNYGRKRR